LTQKGSKGGNCAKHSFVFFGENLVGFKNLRGLLVRIGNLKEMHYSHRHEAPNITDKISTLLPDKTPFKTHSVNYWNYETRLGNKKVGGGIAEN